MYNKKKKALECFSTFVELDHVFWWAAGMWLSPYLISGPMTECLRSMALALALVRLEVDSPLMAKMASPTPSLPSWLTAPPWTTLRTSMPEPSLIALTVIPANTHINTHKHKHTKAQVNGGLAKAALNACQTERQSPKQTPDSGIISIIKTDTRQISTQTWLQMLDIYTASSLTVTPTKGAQRPSCALTSTEGRGHRWLTSNTCLSHKHLTLALSVWTLGGLHKHFINANRQKQVNQASTRTHARPCTYIHKPQKGKPASLQRIRQSGL